MDIFTYKTQFHILRHFGGIDVSYRQNIKNAISLSDEDIDKQLNISGSNFYSHFAQNPLELWERVLNHTGFNIHQMDQWKKGKMEIKLFFNKSDFPQGIAHDSLLSLDEIPTDKKAFITLEDRDGFMVQQIRFDFHKPTWQLNVVLINNETPHILTIFPGIYAPQLPHPERQQKEAYNKSQQFWNSHVLNTFK